jgi:ribonuclease P protein component
MAAPVIRLTRRVDFQRLTRNGARRAMPGVVLQTIVRPESNSDVCRVGFTVSKKVGGAVQRNRAKRRLRAAATEIIQNPQPGRDIVLVGRKATLTRSWDSLRADIRRACLELGVMSAEDKV